MGTTNTLQKGQVSMATLRSLLANHPDWADLPITVYCPDGHLDFVGDRRADPPELGAGGVYTQEYSGQDDDPPESEPFTVLVFTAN